MKKPFVLIIMDGWGISPKHDANATFLAKTPNFDSLSKKYPFIQIHCHGEYVGLPPGQMGNSEVGHLNIGAGRVVYQDLLRITKAIKDGSFFKNKVFLTAMDTAKKNNSSLHLVGLLSDGGVHSDITHLFALLKLAKEKEIKRVYVHALLDGRDTPPKSAQAYIKQLEEKMKEIGIGKIATVMGRYYGMDRDKRWERVKKAYDAMVLGEGRKAKTAAEAVDQAYKNGETDEFVVPTVVLDGATINDHDSIIFYNFRSDRAREITHALVDKDFSYFSRKKHPKVHFVCFAEYDATLDIPIAFQSQKLTNILAEVLSKKGCKQFHAAETEKYAHVTFFLNGGREKPYPGEERLLVPSPKVPTYDLKPEMSAYQVKDEVLKAINSGKYAFIVVNFANPDMVGHSGVLEATIKAIEVVDKCVGEIVTATQKIGGELMITADHGNAEQMVDEKTGEPHTAHTDTNPVPFILVSERKNIKLRQEGILADIAPTILQLMGITKPREMTGKSLCAIIPK